MSPFEILLENFLQALTAGVLVGTIYGVMCVGLGLIFGILGLNESRRTGHGRGQAIAGIVCASIGAVLAIILSIVIWSRIAPCRDQFTSGTPEFNNCVQHHF